MGGIDKAPTNSGYELATELEIKGDLTEIRSIIGDLKSLSGEDKDNAEQDLRVMISRVKQKIGRIMDVADGVAGASEEDRLKARVVGIENYGRELDQIESSWNN